MPRAEWLAAFFGLALVAVGWGFRPSSKEVHAQFQTVAGSPAFVLEVADTPAKIATGLMYRRELPENRGMLFIFNKDGHHRFWMKNTDIPLDLVFLDAQWQVVGVLENLQPHDLTERTVPTVHRYVVELNAGTVRRWLIQPGDRLHY